MACEKIDAQLGTRSGFGNVVTCAVSKNTRAINVPSLADFNTFDDAIFEVVQNLSIGDADSPSSFLNRHFFYVRVCDFFAHLIFASLRAFHLKGVRDAAL